VRYAFIEAHRPIWPLKAMCRTLKVSKQGYFCWRDGRESPRRSADRALAGRIKAVHDAHRQVYGSPRIHRQLRTEGIRVSRKRVERVMRESGIRVLPKRRFVRTTDSDHDSPIAPNLLDQDFRASRPNQRWVTDITYIPTGEGWLYLAAIIDLFSRRVVGWAMDEHMDRTLVLRALDMALRNRIPAKGLIHHSDRGSQYASEDYRQALAAMGIVASMSRRGNCYDNAVIESFWHSLKNELVHRQHFSTRDEATVLIFDYIESFYNRVRLHSSLGYRSPESFEAAHAPLHQEAI
jgi:transposase InsO family protein